MDLSEHRQGRPWIAPTHYRSGSGGSNSGMRPYSNRGALKASWSSGKEELVVVVVDVACVVGKKVVVGFVVVSRGDGVPNELVVIDPKAEVLL